MVADNILREHGSQIEGLLCIDNQGGCLLTRGNASEEHAGLLHEIILKSKSATISEPTDANVIVLQFGSEQKILLKPGDKLSVAVYKISIFASINSCCKLQQKWLCGR